MEYLKKFESWSGYQSSRLQMKYPGKWVSTNPWYYVNKEDIVVIMTEITDSFHHNVDIIETEEIVNKSMVRRVVRADYYLTIPEDKMAKFKRLIKQSEWRLLKLVPGTSHGEFSPSTAYYLKDQYGQNLENPLYHYRIVFKDCKLKME